MVYEVVVPKKVQKDLQRISSRQRKRILVALVTLATNPYLGKKLKGRYRSEYSYRVWPYRIIYRVKEHELLVLIVKIGHRQGVYG